jgi:predicted ATPase
VEALLERETELAALVAAVDAARTGTGALVLVAGEAGIGKTTLVRALRSVPR